MQIIGHRGARSLALENTLASLGAAFDEGADGVEFDVRLTSDGEPVLWHDDDLGAWGGSAVPVCRQRWRDLRGVVLTDDLGNRGVMAHFEEVLDRFGQRIAPINIELKVGADPPASGARLARAVLRCLGRGLPEGWIVSSFDSAALQTFSAAVIDMELAALVCVSSCDLQGLGSANQQLAAEALAALRSAMVTPPAAIHAEFALIDESRCQGWRAAGLGIRTWTVNERADWQRALSFGLDAVITDDPGGARKWLDAAAPGDKGA